MAAATPDIQVADCVHNTREIVKKAKEAKAKIGAENVVDATIGSLYNEEGSIVAFEVYLHHMIKLRKKQRQRMQEAL